MFFSTIDRPYSSVLHSVISLYRVFKNNKKTVNAPSNSVQADAPSNSVQASANVMKEPSPVVPENADNRCRMDIFAKSLHIFFAMKCYV
jgi:hypothetical protein